MCKKYLCVLFSLMLIFSFFNKVYASSESEILLKLLLKKGYITQEEYEEVLSELRGKKSVEKRVEEIEKRAEEMEKEHEELIQQYGTLSERYETMLKKVIHNISIHGGITMITQGSMNNDDNLPVRDDATDATYSIDLELYAPLSEHSEAFMLIEAGDGEGLNDEIPAFHGINDDAFGEGENDLEITEAWYNHRWLDDHLIFTVGKIDLTNYFDANEVANDEHFQFISSGFVNNIA
ncbi:MAG: hypothetical protein D6828_04180, partial [Nitrospirae bacterium]